MLRSYFPDLRLHFLSHSRTESWTKGRLRFLFGLSRTLTGGLDTLVLGEYRFRLRVLSAETTGVG